MTSLLSGGFAGTPAGGVTIILPVGGEIEITLKKARLLANESVTSRSVTVCPLAMSILIVYRRGELGPVAVSSSGP